MWNIIPKVRELDLWMRSNQERAEFICEGHPELAFRRLSGEVLAHSKHSSEGELVRANILNTQVGWDLFSEIKSFHRHHKRILSLNDLLDAAVLALMVKECGKNRVTFLGGDECDGQGIPMMIAA
jgi:predicted RNase H-like nuclease